MLDKDYYDLIERIDLLEYTVDKFEYNRLLEFFSFKAMYRIDQLAGIYKTSRNKILLRGVALLSLGSNLNHGEKLAIVKDGKVVRELDLNIEDKL